MEEWGLKQSEAWYQSLDHGEKEALRVYAASNYTWMNALLRGDMAAYNSLRPSTLDDAYARKLVERAASALAKGRTDSAVVAYRGIQDFGTIGGRATLADFKPGDAIPVKAFDSTTLSKEKAQFFSDPSSVGGGPSNFPNRVVFQVNMPAGSTGAYLNAAGEYELTEYQDEREFLAPPGAEYRVVGPGTALKNVWGHETPVVILERVQ